MDAEEPEQALPTPTTALSSQIKAIAKDTVHKICSGQVVLSLAIAVKELVENAIDAGATLIEIKLRDHGLESVEVSDNGSGVEEHNLEAMTAKYCTSKLREFVDLLGVETFGFRGEALSSLCALCDMVIQTRHATTDVGVKIELDHDGKIKRRSPCARGVGTTVTLTNLFSTLPVRRRDFSRNIKKEFNKMCQILQAYCLVSTGVRIICSNQTPKGAKSVVLQTHGAKDVLANISAVFGTRQIADIVPLKSPFADGELSEEALRTELHGATMVDTTITQFTAADVEHLNQADFQLDGYISSCQHGAGRAAKDRQFYFVNARPCEPKNLIKTVNEIYHRYNAQQQPFVYLNIITARADVDVNLTPDKRQLLLNNEKILLLGLKKALLNTFGNIPSTYAMQNHSIVSMLNIKPKAIKSEAEENTKEAESEEMDVPITSSQRFMDVLSQWRRTGATDGIAPPAPTIKRRCPDELATRTLKLQKIQDFLSREPQNAMSCKSDSESDEEKPAEKEKNLKGLVEKLNESDLDIKKEDVQSSAINKDLKKSPVKLSELITDSLAYDEVLQNTKSSKSAVITCKVQTPSKNRLSFVKATPNDNSEELHPLMLSQSSTDTVKSDCSDFEMDEGEQAGHTASKNTSLNKSHLDLQELIKESLAYDELLKSETPSKVRTPLKNRLSFVRAAPNADDEELSAARLSQSSADLEKSTCSDFEAESEVPVRIEYDESGTDDAQPNLGSGKISTSIEEIAQKLKAMETQERELKERSKLERLRFKSEINPSQNNNAEAELQKEISKEDFARMQIIGQFNLGFIIVQLDDDLFIVDQHASDEKYNFETLQRTTRLQHQPLARPQALDLTAVNEMVLLDHLEIFEQNGFKFEIDANASATKKVRLLGKPFSKNWEFGKEDIDELIFMLQDAPADSVCRPSRIRAMFASRACRKSVMVGKALNKAAMRQLIRHMGEIEQPWNCPHGRPTMRHLINITLLMAEDEEDAAI